MPHKQDVVQLDPVPESVAQARVVVAERLREAERDDLVESAQLVVSELVTNALLHARSPITLCVRGSQRHPRVEVGDRSPDLPAVPQAAPAPATRTDEDPDAPIDLDLDLDELSTSGRGLQMVISHSETWGIDRSPVEKVVWFEPATEPRGDRDTAPQVSDSSPPDPAGGRTGTEPLAEPALDGLLAGPSRSGVPRQVKLLNCPVRAVVGIRRHYDDLQREIRLIGLQYRTDRGRLPDRLVEHAARRSLHRLRAVGSEQLEGAVRRGQTHADLDYRVTDADAAAFSRSVSLLVEADDFCRGERLLTLSLTPRQRAIVVWMCDQVSWQLAGSRPVPWSEEPFGGE